MKKLYTLIGFIQLAILNPIFGQIPGTINVQGVLTNASGQIVPNGNYSITFRLYASAQDATVLWEEKQDNLSVQAGIFSASLGKIKAFTVPFDKTYFLGLQIGQEAELAPRIEMTSTPYSMMAKSVENNSITTAKIQNNAITADKIVPPIVSSLNGIINDGGDIKLKAGKNIEVTPDPNDKSISISVTGLDTVSNDVRYVNENQTNIIGQTMIKDNAVSVEKIIPNVVSSINNVNNDGGNINIVAGANITILNNDQENTITISAVNPGNTNPGIGKINAGKGIAVAGTDGPTAVISVSPNSLTDLEVADKSLSAISLADGAVGNTEIQSNAVTADKIAPNVVSSLSGVSNDGGNINLVAGNNVTIVPNDVNKTITISASGTGGGTSNFTQLIEGNGIGIQNPFGQNTTIGLKPNILLGPAGSLHVLNQNSAAVAGISTNNQGGFLTLSNVQGTQTFGVSNFSDLQPSLYLNSKLGRQVLEMKANEFSDGEINVKSVLANTVIRLTTNDNAGGLINVFNSIGNIAAQLRSDINNEGRLFLNSPNNVRVLNLSTNTSGGGILNLFNDLGAEAVRLTTDSRGGRVNVYNRFENQAARILTNDLGDGVMFFNSGENLPTIELATDIVNGSGAIALYNSDATSVIEMSSYDDRQPYITLFNRLNNKVTELTANEFSDGTLNLFSVLNNPTLQLTANANAGGLINVFNQLSEPVIEISTNLNGDGGIFLSSGNNVSVVGLTTNENGGGYIGLTNQDATEVIRLTTLENRQPRVQVLNRLGTTVAEIEATDFSDGALSLYSVLENPIVLAGANDNAGGLVAVLHKGGTPSAVMTEDEGFGVVGVFSPTQVPLAAMHGSKTTGFGTFTVNGNNENSVMAEMTRDQMSLGGRLGIFNKNAINVANLMSNVDDNGLLQLKNTLGNISSGFLAANTGGMLFLNDGSAELKPRAILENTPDGANFLLYNKASNLIHRLSSKANGSGLLEIKSSLKPGENVVEMGGTEDSEGYLYLKNRDSKVAVYLSAAAGDGTLALSDITGRSMASLDGSRFGGSLSIRNADEKPVHYMGSNGKTKEGFYSIFNKSDINKDRLSMGGDSLGNGYLNVFNFNGQNTFFMGHNQFADGVISIKNSMGNLGALLEALKDGGSVTVTDGKPSTNHRAVLLNGLNGGRLNLFNTQTKLVSVVSVGDNGEGLWQIVSKQDLTKARVELAADNAGTGYLKLFNALNNNTSFLGHDLLGNGSLEMRNNLGNRGGFFTAYTDGGRLAITDGSAAGNHRGLLENTINGGKFSIFNKTNIPVDDITVANNGEGLIRIAARPDFSKSRLELGGDDGGAGFLRIFNNAFKKTGELMTNGNLGGELNVFNTNGFNTATVGQLSTGAGLVEVASPAGVKVGRLTASDGTGYIGLDNIDKLEVVRITANLGKGGGMGLRNQTGADMINLTQTNGYGTILVNDNKGGLLNNITNNTEGGGWMAANGPANTLMAYMTGTTEGGIFNINNKAGKAIAGLTYATSNKSGYIFLNTEGGKEVLRASATPTGGGYLSVDNGYVSVNNTAGNSLSYLFTNTNNGGYLGVANGAGNDRARLTTVSTGSGYASISNATGNEVLRLTTSTSNHGAIENLNSTGAVASALYSTVGGNGWVRANNSAGAERAYMVNENNGGLIGVFDNSGIERVRMSAVGNVTVLNADGSGSVLTPVNLSIYDNLQHPRAEVRPGIIYAKGPNGVEHSFMATTSGGTNFGYIGVCNSAIPNSPVKAGMYTNNSNQGVLFADIKNFKIDYPGRPDKQIWYGSLEGPELAAYIRGTGSLKDGKATIEFTDHYQKLANTGTMTVILTPLSGKSKGLAVVKKSGTGFQVEELLEGSGSYDFDWEVKCVRKGHEGFEVVRNKSDEPKPFKGDDAPVSLPDRNKRDIEVDQVIHEKVVKQ